MTVRVFLRPKGAGAANSAKGAGPHSGGGPSLVEVQSLGSGGGASSTQLVSWTTSPKVERSTVLTQTLEPAAGCCPDLKSTRLNSSHSQISYAVFCLDTTAVIVPSA